jgi:hypothetical protein
MVWQSGLRNLLAFGVAAALLAACAVDPPVQQMSDARQAISAAEEAQADRFARADIDEARRYLAEAEADIAAGAYGPARTKALRSQGRAMRALRASLDARDGE